MAVVTYIQHFQPYLLGREFQLRTDHGSLAWLTSFKEPEGQLARWLEQLQEFQFQIIHRPGKHHTNADALSRRPCSQCGRESHEIPMSKSLESSADTMAAASLSNRSPQAFHHLQLEDGPIHLLLEAINRNVKPSMEDVRGEGPEAQRLLQLWDRLLTDDDGLLYRKYDDIRGTQSWQQSVVPHTLRDEIMEQLHAGALEGHLGIDKTVTKIRERFYWPGIYRDVKRWISTCPSCALAVPRESLHVHHCVTGDLYRLSNSSGSSC